MQKTKPTSFLVGFVDLWELCVDQWIPYFTCEYHACTTRASFNHTALITACSYH
ncbi:MAG: hypothetical protein J6V99_02780 [Neisseriaceae bacterium]|nr:hypothetical protein [Neisseriaceae bacterium]